MADYFGSYKLCATCTYWAGQRNVDRFGNCVTNCAGEGRCANPQAPHWNGQRMANSCACFSYEKWSVLK